MEEEKIAAEVLVFGLDSSVLGPWQTDPRVCFTRLTNEIENHILGINPAQAKRPAIPESIKSIITTNELSGPQHDRIIRYVEKKLPRAKVAKLLEPGVIQDKLRQRFSTNGHGQNENEGMVRKFVLDRIPAEDWIKPVHELIAIYADRLLSQAKPHFTRLNRGMISDLIQAIREEKTTLTSPVIKPGPAPTLSDQASQAAAKPDRPTVRAFVVERFNLRDYDACVNKVERSRYIQAIVEQGVSQYGFNGPTVRTQIHKYNSFLLSKGKTGGQSVLTEKLIQPDTVLTDDWCEATRRAVCGNILKMFDFHKQQSESHIKEMERLRSILQILGMD